MKRPDECKGKAFGAVATIEHLKPQSRGGNNHPYNIMAACSGCNLGRVDAWLDLSPLTWFKVRQYLLPVWSPLTRRPDYIKDIFNIYFKYNPVKGN